MSGTGNPAKRNQPYSGGLIISGVRAQKRRIARRDTRDNNAAHFHITQPKGIKNGFYADFGCKFTVNYSKYEPKF
ncbi:MAG: hypothetical protein RL013_1739 [Bacteroidota bacterium]|jgi:hypothetical protein